MKYNVRKNYGMTLKELGKDDESIVVFDADLSGSTNTALFGAEFPSRFFNMGICEQDMVATAAGMAACGKRPYVSTFCAFVPGRAFDQVRMCVAYPGLNVKFISTHGGISVGKDGASHHANEDLSMMRTLPNMKIFVPSDPFSTEETIRYIHSIDSPCYVRLFRDSVEEIYDRESPLDPTKAQVLLDGDDVAIISCGFSTHSALEAAKKLSSQGVSAMVLDVMSLRPFDAEGVIAAAKRCGRVLTVEDHSIRAGLGGCVCEYLSERHPTIVKRLGIRRFAESGSPERLYEKYGLSVNSIISHAKELL